MYMPNMFDPIAQKLTVVRFFFLIGFFLVLLKIALLMWERELLFLNPPSLPSSDLGKEIVDGHAFYPQN